MATQPDHVRSLALGIGAGLATVAAMSLARSVLDLSTGLLAVAAFGGWAIGLGVAQGAWRGRAHPPGRRGVLVAAVLATATWLGWLVGSWLVALAIRQGSALDLWERLTQTPLLEWLVPQLGILELAALVLLVASAAYGARDR